MEAIEFLKAAKRRYESNPNKYCDVIYFDDSNFETYVKDVEEWAREHPAKTRQTEFLKMFPNVKIRSDGIINIPPCNLEKEFYDDCENYPKDCFECFKEFWSKKVK